VTRDALSLGLEISKDKENTEASKYYHVCGRTDHQRGGTALSAKRNGPKSHLQLSHRDAGSGPRICHNHPRNRTAANHEAHSVSAGRLKAVALRVVDLFLLAIAVSGVVPFHKAVGVGGGTASAVAVAIAPTPPPPPPLPGPPILPTQWRQAGRSWRRRCLAVRRRRRPRCAPRLCRDGDGGRNNKTLVLAAAGAGDENAR